MITVDSITIKEFRGIRSLPLDLGGKNYAICGPNGTGKSGIVDALEFVLTGNVSRLTGKGSKVISVKEHAPHVDSRNAPEQSEVSAVVSLVGTNKRATITRTVGSLRRPRITPQDKDVLAALAAVEVQADFVLSRRELIRYVLAAPGDRAAEVRALLRLEEVEKVRLALQKIANGLKKEADDAKKHSKSAADALTTAMGITSLNAEPLLGAANAKRAIADLPKLPVLTSLTSLKDGLASQSQGTGAKLSKAQATQDLESVRKAIAALTAAELTKQLAEAGALAADLQANPLFALSVERDAFLQKGQDLLLDEECPFCSTAWDLDQLKLHVQQKRDELATVSASRQKLEELVTPIRDALLVLQTRLRPIQSHALIASPPLPTPHLTSFIKSIDDSLAALVDVLPLDQLISALGTAEGVPPEGLEEIATLKAAVGKLPDPSESDAAREWLIVAQERLEAWREARRKQQLIEARSARCRQISDVFAATSDQVLGKMYESVQGEFGELYAEINREDEGEFSAQLIPEQSSLGFNVNFYGRGFFPPGAYHSEGHQDGMGLCLYLALMKYMHGDGFTLAVLDDVLMSVDAGHRREVCRMLKKRFPNTQFVLTTHDPVWLRYMKSAGLIAGKASIQFRKWDVEVGPVDWNDRDVWAEIAASLDHQDVRSASVTLRSYLEHEAGELCGLLRARVEYRGDGQHELEDVLPTAINQLRELFKKGQAAAKSWNHNDQATAVGDRLAGFEKLAEASNAERWQINAAIHHNAWANLVKEDFEPVVGSFRDLIGGFRCADCEGFLYVSPARGSGEALRCNCGATNISLVKK